MNYLYPALIVLIGCGGFAFLCYYFARKQESLDNDYHQCIKCSCEYFNKCQEDSRLQEKFNEESC